jgi:thiamine biosynthesis lipoprotein
MKKLLIIIAAAVFLLVSCGSEKYESQSYAMSVYLTQTLTGSAAESAAKANEKLILDIENQLSATLPSSDVYILNQNGKGTLGSCASEVLELAQYYTEYTDGAFCFTLRRLTELWDIGGDNQRVPERSEISAALAESGTENISIDGDVIDLNGCRIDFGGIAKGYALDCMYENCVSMGTESGIIDLGGSIAAIGTNDGEKWTVGIKDPEEEGGIAATAQLSDAFISTSGVYQRYFIQDGVRYHHVLDPQTGYPADGGVMSVSVISESGTETDALSTALLVMGSEKGTEFAEQNDIAAVFIFENGEMYISSAAERYSVEKY